MKEEWLRTGSLLGEDGVNRLHNSSVAVFGIGGVGSYAVEALARSAVGSLHLYDNDTVTKSNLNRQLVATQQTIGQYKTAVALARCHDINPDCRVSEHRVLVTPETEIPFDQFDGIIDAVDQVTAKIYIITEAIRRQIPIISVMGTGNRLDPSQLAISDLFQTEGCPLARIMRHELRKRAVDRLDVVWSSETPIKPAFCGEVRETGRTVPGSMAPVPGAAGLLAASYMIQRLLKRVAL